ncbi:T9SS sorting signal type C domain-containing protein, partial [Flavobacterium sp. AED]|uniref:T9SS sorting signal type C domain-containing protein n=1 Tax=Flavobacterium sp. AED TaxID=1423323 RepID=UPI00068CFF94
TITNYNASYTYAASPSTGVVISGNTVTAPTGSYALTATLGTCTSVASSGVTINAQPATPVQPILSTVIQPTCSASTGSFTITNYNASYTYVASPSAGVVISGNTVTAPTGSYTLTATLGTCTSVASSGVTINAQPTTPVQPILSTAIQPTCSASTGSFTITNYNAFYTYAASPSTGVVISGNTVTAPTGSYTLTATLGTCTSVASSGVTINAQPTTPVQPILSTVIQPTCSTSTGSFTITNYNASYTYTASPSAGVTISGNTVTAPSGSYTLTATLGTCTSVASSGVTINNQAINTWNGSVWSTGLAPTSSDKIIFDGFYSSATNINACSCQVNSGKSVTILSGGTLKITNEVTVLGTGTLTFENNSSLVQINDAAINTGSITYRRQTNSISKFDYTYWSSPVSPQTLYNVSPNTLYDKFFSYNAILDVWTPENSGNNMVKGIGYIIRGPENYVAPTPPGLYEANFKGVPNNGTITVSIGGLDSSNLIGNPYPSALDADKFLTDNSSVLDGTLYFWTHSTAIANNVYSSNDYASYNLTGGVGTDGVAYLQGGTVAPNGGQKPSGKIGSGQGFFATGKASGTATFNNSMRVGVGSITGDNSQFFKMTNSKTTSLIEKHRIWLNLTNAEGAFKQTLLGYVTNATNGYDNSFDGESFDGNQFVDFYSVNEDKNLTIQGRALPFDEDDVVSLGFSSTIEGAFSIGIDEVDGLFTSQDVFIEDKNTNSIKNLKEGPYTFTTESGTFNDRFVLRYTNTNKTLDTDSFETLEKTILVSNKNKLIKINSSVEMINKVQVYDLLGRSVYQKIDVDLNELTISNLVINNQVLLVKILLQNGKTVTKKIIY